MIQKLTEGAEKEAMEWISHAIDVAQKSLCLRRRCGATIVDSMGFLITNGCNSPPNRKKIKKCKKDEIKEFIVQKIRNGEDTKIQNPTCCIHAEERAILDALIYNDEEDIFEGSTIYFASVNKDGLLEPSGRPYCTRCSTLALDMGISSWCLYHSSDVWNIGEGMYKYTAYEYNEVTFSYHKPSLDDLFSCREIG